MDFLFHSLHGIESRLPEPLHARCRMTIECKTIHKPFYTLFFLFSKRARSGNNAASRGILTSVPVSAQSPTYNLFARVFYLYLYECILSFFLTPLIFITANLYALIDARFPGFSFYLSLFPVSYFYSGILFRGYKSPRDYCIRWYVSQFYAYFNSIYFKIREKFEILNVRAFLRDMRFVAEQNEAGLRRRVDTGKFSDKLRT